MPAKLNEKRLLLAERRPIEGTGNNPGRRIACERETTFYASALPIKIRCTSLVPS